MLLTVIRVLLCAASAAGLCFFIWPMSVNVINIGNIAAAVFCVWLFVMCCKPLHQFFKGLFCRFALTRALYYLINGCFIAFAVMGVAMSALMIYGMNQAPANKSTAVVLGAQVLPSGNPSTILRGRIEAAEKYLTENPEAKAVLSGGQGIGEPMSEAQCMYENLVKKGIAPERLYIEDKSTNTAENLKFSDKIIRQEGLRADLALITDGFHQERARIIANQLGLKGQIGAYNAATDIKYAPTYFVREWFGIPYQLVLKHT